MDAEAKFRSNKAEILFVGISAAVDKLRKISFSKIQNQLFDNQLLETNIEQALICLAQGQRKRLNSLRT